MSYRGLKKIYFCSKNEFEAAYKSRIASSYALHLNFEIGENPAFVMQVPEILIPIINIQRLDKEIGQMCAHLPGVALNQFSKRCLVDEIVLTNSIEGVNSTRREITEVLDGLEKQDRRKRFYGLVQKYQMLQTKNSLPLSTCADIREIYNELVLPEVLEESKSNRPDGVLFRKDSVSVQDVTGKEIHHGVYPEKKLTALLEQGLTFLNDTQYDVFIRIAVFHYLIGYIHPFYDGNGRLSRFISSYLLSKALNPLIGYRLSYTIKENIKKYYDAFKECNDFRSKGDLTPFVIMFLGIITQAMQQLLEALKKRESAWYSYLEFVEACPLDEKSKNVFFVLIQASLFSEIGISISQLLSGLKVTRNTLRKRLNSLEAISQQLVVCTRQGKENYYQVNLKELERLRHVPGSCFYTPS